MNRLQFAITSAISFCVVLPLGYRVGEDIGRAEGREQGRNEEKNRQRLLERINGQQERTR